MTVSAKICGIRDRAALDAAVNGGAQFVGFVFYPRSPRNVSPKTAAGLISGLDSTVSPVGLVVDADDAALDQILELAPLKMIQCHGSESPSRLAEIESRFGLPVIKAVNIAGPEDVNRAKDYEQTADWLLFDAKPPKSMPNALPGGNALAFDWDLIARCTWSPPWMLSGGLNVGNVAKAVEVSGAQIVDVSSGVEDRPGVKSTARIAAFLDAVRAL